MNAPRKNNAAESVEPVTDGADPFADLSKLRLSQSFVEQAGVKKLLTTVWVRKPLPQDFVRVHPDAAYRDAFAFIELKEDREHYLVMPSIADAVPTEVVMKTLYTTINRQGTVTLWPVPLPPSGGRDNEWHRTARVAAERAIGCWVRIKSNTSIGANEIFEAPGSIPDPVWPEHTFQDLLRIGFRDKIIQSLDHPVLKRLRGE